MAPPPPHPIPLFYRATLLWLDTAMAAGACYTAAADPDQMLRSYSPAAAHPFDASHRTAMAQLAGAFGTVALLGLLLLRGGSASTWRRVNAALLAWDVGHAYSLVVALGARGVLASPARWLGMDLFVISCLVFIGFTRLAVVFGVGLEGHRDRRAAVKRS